MKIRVINENDWERTYELDKSIIRVGSQISCDIQLTGNDIQPMQMQLVRSGGKEVKYTLRIFTDNVKIARGEQIFTGQPMIPYEVLDGDKLIFSSYRMILSLEDEQTRIRSTKNMEAKMYIQKRDLSIDSPINGVLRLKNTGSERACQFRMQIRGIPDECLTSAPLPYLYPGGKSTVGFMITHLQTKPSPGFHTVSIVLTAPNEYFGEILEFRQDIYVNPVFKNEIVLEDDSAELRGFNKAQETEEKKTENPEPQPAVSFIQETARMIPGQAVIEKEETETESEKNPIVISGADTKNAFSDEIEEEAVNENRRRRSTRKEKINVIRNDEEAFSGSFEEEDAQSGSVISDESPGSSEAMEEQKPVPAEASDIPDTPEVPAEPETMPGSDAEPEELPATQRKSSGRKRKAASEGNTRRSSRNSGSGSVDETENVSSEPEPKADREPVMTVAEPEPEAAEEPVMTVAEPEPKPAEEPVMTMAEPEPKPAEEPVMTMAESEPKPAEEPVMTMAEPEPKPAEEPIMIIAEPEPKPEITKEPDLSGMHKSDEEGHKAIPEETADEETVEASVSSAAEETQQSPADLYVSEEEPAAGSGTGQDSGRSKKADRKPAKKAGKNVIMGSGLAPIPVVHNSDLFDFAEEDDRSASLSEKEPKVRFVKRGKFDE